MKKLFTIIFLTLFACVSIPVANEHYPEFIKQGVYRGKRPGGIGLLKQAGINSILDLENDTIAVNKEKRIAETLGMRFYNIPMSNFTRPSVEALREGVRIIEAEKVTGIYVHCLHGQDRTGLQIAADRMLIDKWDILDAYDEAKEHGHKYIFYSIFNWKKSLEELEGKK